MPFRKSLFLLFAMTLSFTATGQNTVGTRVHKEGSMEGLTFFSPFSGTKAYLVDNCGRLINQWDRGTRPGLSAYFLDNGLMFRTFQPPRQGPFTSASNAGGLEMVDWDNNTVWTYEINTDTQISHHDAIIMPNGNILVLTWQLAYEDELVELGRDPDEIDPAGYAWSEKIIEIEPLDSDQAQIIWEWEIKDHYIQDFDSAKLGYGVVSQHPELFNINLPELNSSNSHSSFDWNHFNSIDYDEMYDQILISVRNSDEIWILDHSTTTEEASTHSGGRYGIGGDILYRWGNPSAYERGVESDQKLFGQHGVNWIDRGLVDAGKILIFNNGKGRPVDEYSTAEILVPPRDSIGGYIQPEDAPFEPEAHEWIYGVDEVHRRSDYLSNAQRLPNGNTLVNYGWIGLVHEVNPLKEVVWAYVIPLFGDTPVIQGENTWNNGVFRVYKYPYDYQGFEGMDLTPGETIEIGTDLTDCPLSTATDDIVQFDQVDIIWISSEHLLKINVPMPIRLDIALIDVSGRILMYTKADSYPFLMQVPSLMSGIYFLSVVNENGDVVTQKIFNAFSY